MAATTPSDHSAAVTAASIPTRPPNPTTTTTTAQPSAPPMTVAVAPMTEPPQPDGGTAGISRGVNGGTSRPSAGSNPDMSPRPPPVPAPLQGPAPPVGAGLPVPLLVQAQHLPSQQHAPRPSMTHGKVAIVEPPHRRVSNGLPHGFPSPTRDHAQEPKFHDDASRLAAAVRQSLPEAVRRVVRDHWEKTLVGSEFHLAFILNTVIHRCEGQIIRRSIREFGNKMVAESKAELIGHFQKKDIDDVADAILHTASDDFLDKALEKRLATIDARSLINALARAERLGYENNDVLDQQAPPPSMPAAPTVQHAAQPQYSTPSQPQRQPQSQVLAHPHTQAYTQPPPRPEVPQYFLQTPAPGNGSQAQALQCTRCWRRFDKSATFEYHMKKLVCMKTPPSAAGFPFACTYCGAGFITHLGKQYHIAHKVCGDHGVAPPTPRDAPPPATPGSPIIISSGRNSPQIPSVATSRAPLKETPVPVPLPGSTPTSSAVTISTPSSAQHWHHADANNVTSSPANVGPYAHLTPESRARMDDELRQAEENFILRCKDAEALETPAARKAKVDGLQNSFNTKQSIIRKKYGVRLRQRRTRAEIDSERERLINQHSGPSSKRQRTDDGTGTPKFVSGQPTGRSGPGSTPFESPSKHLSVSDMNSAGLGGSSATVATQDPTLSQPQSQQTPSKPPPSRHSLSAYQKNGVRVDIHTPRPAGPSPATAQTSGSATAPVVLDDDDSDSTETDTGSDSDSDEEIPAVLPAGRKASGAVQ